MEKNSLFNKYSFSDLFWDEKITKKLEVRDHYKLLKKAHQYCYESVKQELENGKSVIVSNTMTTIDEVQEYQNLANKMGIKFISMIIENRHNGKSNHKVPISTIKDMNKRFDQSVLLSLDYWALVPRKI